MNIKCRICREESLLYTFLSFTGEIFSLHNIEHRNNVDTMQTV